MVRAHTCCSRRGAHWVDAWPDSRPLDLWRDVGILACLSLLWWEFVIIDNNWLPAQFLLLTIKVCVTASPVLWKAGRASVWNMAIWGMGAATFASFVVPLLMLIGVCLVLGDCL